MQNAEPVRALVLAGGGAKGSYQIGVWRALQELGWQPATSFQDGIRATVQWYRNHQDWWQEILSGRYAEENRRIGTIR